MSFENPFKKNNVEMTGGVLSAGDKILEERKNSESMTEERWKQLATEIVNLTLEKPELNDTEKSRLEEIKKEIGPTVYEVLGGMSSSAIKATSWSKLQEMVIDYNS